MKTHPASWLLAAALLAAPPVNAATLTTTMVYSTADSNIVCNVVNAGKKTFTVVIRVRDLAGDVLVESGAFEIGPGQGNGIGDNANDDYFGYCEFEVKGSRKAARASLQLKAGGLEAPTVVVPAQ